MATSDRIAEFILGEIEDSGDGFAVLQRSALAERFSCVPSQINYVISTRFSPERGYVVDSRRGGGGYIRIRRVRESPRAVVMHAVNAAGASLDERTAAAFIANLADAGVLDGGSARLMCAAVSAAALRAVPPDRCDAVRAGIFKQMLVGLLAE